MGNIFVAGDIHGNYKSLMHALKESGWDEKEDKLICVGDVVDRGKENTKVLNYIADHQESVLLVCGNHEYQHRQMLKYYKVLAKAPEIRKLAASIFQRYKDGETVIRDEKDIEALRCTQEERKKYLEKRANTFIECQKQFLVYTLAWDDDSLWRIVLYLLDEMCGPPYDAQRTIYEYLRGTSKERDRYEWLFSNQALEYTLTPSQDAKYRSICITHGNPFGSTFAYDREEMRPGHDRTLYIYGHVPHDKIMRVDRERSGCTYIDLDTSPECVSVIKLQDIV